MATNFGTKIATNAFLMRDYENVITYNRVSVVSQCKEDISDCRVLSDVAMTTEFWPK